MNCIWNTSLNFKYKEMIESSQNTPVAFLIRRLLPSWLTRSRKATIHVIACYVSRTMSTFQATISTVVSLFALYNDKNTIFIVVPVNENESSIDFLITTCIYPSNLILYRTVCLKQIDNFYPSYSWITCVWNLFHGSLQYYKIDINSDSALIQHEGMSTNTSHFNSLSI